jgi:hypothetical protein
VQQQVAAEANLWRTAQGIIRTRGFVGLYRGYNALLVLEAPGRGVYMLVYEMTKRAIAVEVHGDERLENATATRMQAAAIAGLVSWFVVYPFDVVKARLMLDIEKKKYRGALQCVAQSYAEGGVASFYRGIFYTLIRAAPVAATVLPMYELSKDFLLSIM